MRDRVTLGFCGSVRLGVHKHFAIATPQRVEFRLTVAVSHPLFAGHGVGLGVGQRHCVTLRVGLAVAYGIFLADALAARLQHRPRVDERLGDAARVRVGDAERPRYRLAPCHCIRVG